MHDTDESNKISQVFNFGLTYVYPWSWCSYLDLSSYTLKELQKASHVFMVTAPTSMYSHSFLTADGGQNFF